MINMPPYRGYDLYLGEERRGTQDGVTYYVAVNRHGENERQFTEALSITNTAIQILKCRDPKCDWVKHFLDLVSKRARARIDLGYDKDHDYVIEITSSNVDHLSDQDVTERDIAMSLLRSLQTVRQEEPNQYKKTSTDLEGLASILGTSMNKLQYVASQLVEEEAIHNLEVDQIGYYITNKGLRMLDPHTSNSAIPVSSPTGLTLIHPGHQFGVYLTIRDLIIKASRKILVIDPYASVEWLALFAAVSEVARPTIKYLYEKAQDPEFVPALKRYVAQYGNLEVRRSTQLHDRFLCIDDVWYQLGTSLNSLGYKKLSTFTALESTEGKDLHETFSALWVSAVAPDL